MSQPVVLLFEPEEERRREIGRQLAKRGYEVVLVVSPEEARRFASALDLSVTIAPAGAPGFGDRSILELLSPSAETRAAVLLLGERPPEEIDLPEEVLYLDVAALTFAEQASRIEVALVGRQVGIEPDVGLEYLVGDLAHHPLMAVIQSLHHLHFSGRIDLDAGAVFLRQGSVISGRAGAVSGLKALCRLGRIREGPFRVIFELPTLEDEVRLDLESVIVTMIEASLGDLPDARARFNVRIGAEFFDRSFDAVERAVLARAQGGVSGAELLDQLSAPDTEIARRVAGLEVAGILERESPPPKVRVVTDSTADLPARLVASHDVVVVPLTVHFGPAVYRDRIDLEPARFYELLAEGGEHPSSSPPRSEDFADSYRRFVDRQDVLSIHLSSELSETLGRAREAAEASTVGTSGAAGRIQVVDSRLVSMGQGLLVLMAARMAARGLGLDEISNRMPALIERIEVLFLVDTLEYLARGGRIGRARAAIGGLLGIKPILGLADGEVVQVSQVRGGRAAHPKLVALVGERVAANRPLVVAIAHANAPVWADRLRGLIEGEFVVSEVIQGEMGPVVGTHVGPGAVGVAVFQPSGDEVGLLQPID